MKTSANMATIPEREDIAKMAVASLIDQVDTLRIYLNRYKEIPQWCKHPKITAVMGEDLNASGKFFWALDNEEYYFTVDDDLLYIGNYIETMLSIYKQYRKEVGKPIAISLHGKVMKPTPIDSYFKDYTGGMHCLKTFEQSMFVHVLGNNSLLINTSENKIDYKKFKYLFMDDICVSKQLQEQGAALIAVAHDKGVVEYMPPSVPTLWDIYHDNDAPQTEVYNSTTWYLGGKENA